MRPNKADTSHMTDGRTDRVSFRVACTRLKSVNERFLVAKSNSIRGFVRQSVGPSVRGSVRQAFLENREFKQIK